MNVSGELVGDSLDLQARKVRFGNRIVCCSSVVEISILGLR
jgi:hypothetical protein